MLKHYVFIFRNLANANDSFSADGNNPQEALEVLYKQDKKGLLKHYRLDGSFIRKGCELEVI